MIPVSLGVKVPRHILNEEVSPFFFTLGAGQAPEATVVFVPFWMLPWFGRRPASYLALTIRKTVHADEFREEAPALFV